MASIVNKLEGTDDKKKAEIINKLAYANTGNRYLFDYNCQVSNFIQKSTNPLRTIEILNSLIDGKIHCANIASAINATGDNDTRISLIPAILLAEDEKGNKRFDKKEQGDILSLINDENAHAVKYLINKKDSNGRPKLSYDDIVAVLPSITKDNFDKLPVLENANKFEYKESGGILSRTNADNKQGLDQLLDYHAKGIEYVLSHLNKGNIDCLNEVKNAKDKDGNIRFNFHGVGDILSAVNPNNRDEFVELLNELDEYGYPKYEVQEIVSKLKETQNAK